MSEFDHKGKGSFSESAEKAKKLMGVGVQQKRGPSKLEELFKHPLYNLPRPELQEDDWLLRLKTEEEAKDTETEEENPVADDSEWLVKQLLISGYRPHKKCLGTHLMLQWHHGFQEARDFMKQSNLNIIQSRFSGVPDETMCLCEHLHVGLSLKIL